MKKAELIKKFTTEFNNDFSKEIFDLTYAYGEEDINERLYKVAETVASVETDKEYWTEKFYEVLSGFKFVPGGRILSNAGVPLRGTTMINCFVSGFQGEDQDSMEGILSELRRQALILKSEGGYGFCADVLRPRGAFIGGIGNESPGSVSMLEMWDTQSKVITEGSGKKTDRKDGKKKIRKGAQMVTMNCMHPDIEEFITAKQTAGRLTKCNMSVLITDSFIDAVKSHTKWELKFPDYESDKELYKKNWDGDWKKWESLGGKYKVYKTYEDANELWNLITQSTYTRNEPGVLFIDRINDFNNLYYTENISATNPCGEQLLPPGGVCLLSSLNLTQFIKDGDWDYEKLAYVIPTAIRFMDNVNDLTYVPLDIQKENLLNKRRIGLGIMGYGSALIMLKKRYGSKDANYSTEKLMEFIKNTAYKSSALLAAEKGSFPLYNSEKYLSGRYVKTLETDTIELIKKHGIRNSHLMSIQPTGNSSVLVNNVSGGLEPIFSFKYTRTFIIPFPPAGLQVPNSIDWMNKSYTGGDNKWSWVKEGDDDLLFTMFDSIPYKIDRNRGLTKETEVIDYGVKYLIDKNEWNPESEYTANTENLTIDDHLIVMELMAKRICSAMSKTINIPNDYSYDDFKNVYLKAFDTNVIKGVTTYRAGTMASVLKTEKKEIRVELNPDVRNGHIIRHAAPIRPKSVPCEVHQITSGGVKWYVFVGMVLDQMETLSPYEVFAFKKKNISFNVKSLKGTLTKVKRGRYDFESDNGLVLEDLASLFEVDEQEALTRMISTNLRHGVEIKFVVEQLNKAEGNISAFSKAVARCLKKYIPDHEIPTDDTDCDGCGAKNSMIYIEGCVKCKHCGWSKC